MLLTVRRVGYTLCKYVCHAGAADDMLCSSMGTTGVHRVTDRQTEQLYGFVTPSQSASASLKMRSLNHVFNESFCYDGIPTWEAW